MSLFAWANRQLEQLTDKLAPVPNDPSHRFSKACSSNDGQLALQLLSSMPPPLPDGTHSSPLDPFGTIINKQRGTLAIHCAAEYAQINVVKGLIAQFGVSPEQFDQQGNTPLHYAAASQYPQALELVKMFIKEYNVSATVQNMNGQTPYDLAKIDSIRQYLLPIQLQSETQKCIDNGGIGLPEGIDMGGLAIKKDLPPPPIVGGGFSSPLAAAGNVGGGNVHSFSAVNMKSASKYAVPVFGHQQQQQQNSTVPAAENFVHPMQSVNRESLSNAADSQSIVSPTVGISTSPEIQANSNTVTKVSSPLVELNTTIASPVVGQKNESRNLHLPDSAEKLVSSTVNDLSGTVSSGNTQVPAVNVHDSTTHAMPLPGATLNLVPVSSSNTMPLMTANSSQQTVQTTVGKQYQQVETDSAPSSGSGYARRGYSSAAVLPTNAKYKPDGFHSSSSDISLQKKYGHDPSISGPPSGTFRTPMIAPPPSAPAAVFGSNPYAASSTYGVSPAMARPRYPTYDAISDTVGAAPGGSATGYNYNPYAMSQMPGVQFNMYNPGTSSHHQNYMQQNVYGENNHQIASFTPWKTATAPDGRTYYYNEITNETTWEMPSDMFQQPAPSTTPANAANHGDTIQSTEPTISAGQTTPVRPETSTVEATSMNENDISQVASSTGTKNVDACNASTKSFFDVSVSDDLDSKSYQPSDSVSGKFNQSVFEVNDNSDPNVDSVAFNDQFKSFNIDNSCTDQLISATSASELFEKTINASPTTRSEAPCSLIESKPSVETTSHTEFMPTISIDIHSAAMHVAQETLNDDKANISQDVDFLPQPPFVVDDSNEDDDFADDDLPPPPMIDISLS